MDDVTSLEQGSSSPAAACGEVAGVRTSALAGQVALEHVLTAFQLAERYDVVDVDGSRPDVWRDVVEVQDRGLPADVTGHR